MNSSDIEGRVALVTGSERGIGAAIALRLAAGGANVAVNAYQEPENAAEVAERIAEHGVQSCVVTGDVSVAADVHRMVDETRESIGAIGILVNNAGIAAGTVPWTGVSEQEWDRIMAVNLRGAFLCTRAVHDDMRTRRWGRIINISSATVHVGYETGIAYVASKAGLIGLTRSLAREIGPEGITVNAITPGAVYTDLLRARDPEGLTRVDYLRRQAIPEHLGADDIAGAAAYLCSDDARLVTGQVLNVDAGWAMP